MPNPVVSFELRGPDPAALRKFYTDVFGWDIYVFPGGEYSGVETSAHTHDESTGATTYTGKDAFMNEGVETNEEGGHRGWRYKGESNWRAFEPGISGGIGPGERGVMFYIQVPDLDASLADVSRGGGSTVLPPTNVAPEVRIATFRDPAGNVVGLALASNATG